MSDRRRRGGGRGVIAGYDAAVLSTQSASLISYLPLAETSGTAADDASRNARSAAYGAGVTVGGDAFMDGVAAPLLGAAATSYVNWYSASLAAAWTPELFTIVIWAKPIATTWSDGTLHSVWTFYPSGNYHARMYIQNNVLTILYRVNAVNYSVTVNVDTTAYWYTGWNQLALTVNRAQNRARAYVNGSQVGADLTGFAAWSGALLSTLTNIGALNTSGSQTWGAAPIARAALWGTELTASEISALYAAAVIDRNIMIIGDSKSGSSNAWRYLLRQSKYNSGTRYTEAPTEYGQAGYTVANMRTYIETNLPGASGVPDDILINLGANDAAAIGGAITENAWKADYNAILSALRTKYPGKRIFIARPWRRSYASASNTMATWIADIVAAYPQGVYLGHDERTWLEGGDDGATMSTDGIHYSTAGQTAAAAQWAARL